MTEDWLKRWEEGRIGWHEPAGNAALKHHWPALPQGSRVLVPLCGKTPDIAWLAGAGYDVVGVELSQKAVLAFFEEQHLDFARDICNGLERFRAAGRSITLHCGDYFAFSDSSFDALYDRGALVAFPVERRPDYVTHTIGLLQPDSARFVITLEYDQAIVNGPPFAVMPDEVLTYWTDLERVAEKDDIDNCPPKFRAAGLERISEVAWLSV